MKKLLPVLFLFLACSAFGAGVERITLLITVTNTPKTSNTLTVNASTRIWTNASTLTTILTNLINTNYSTTNLYNQIASYPYGSGIVLEYASSNAIRLRGPIGGALAGSVTGPWATLTLSTQSGPQTYTALWPIENMVGPTNRTNEASALVSGLGTFSTNAFATNANALSNHITKGASPRQHVAAPITLNGGVSGILEKITNGYGTNTVLDSPLLTNGVNYGASFRSEYPGISSIQFGSNAMANAVGAVAVGNNAIATVLQAVAVGTSALATNRSTAIGSSAVAGDASIAIGRSATALYTQSAAVGQSAATSGQFGSAFGDSANAGEYSVAVGRSSSATGTNAIAVGAFANVGVNARNSIVLGTGSGTTFSNSIVVGTVATGTTTDQILLGTSQWVDAGVGYRGPLLTNSTHRGTNVINGRIDFTSRANAGLANGNNAGVVLGTNVYVRLSGATTIAALAGFASEQDGSFHIVQFTGAITNTFLNESGVEATAANRIVTGTGGDISFTNTPLVLGILYDLTAARWRIMSFHR